MSRKTYVELIDDIDDTEQATGTVEFSLDGVDYEIDLNDPHAAQLREDIGQWIAHARRRPGSRRRVARVSAEAGGGPSPTVVRAWAKRKGIEVGARGRIPAEVTEQFLREQSAPASVA